ncbi:MAG: type-F conjugative transfer system secretin TraK [Pseudomonadales bacterium]|nr:type-F conjugative transfer system secretin TraK [Pseudomonadales bacterium]
MKGILLWHKVLCALIIFSYFTLASASQTIEVENNGTYKVKVSLTELTRITVENGRIRKAWAMNTAWETKADKDTGELYIRPRDGSTKPFSFFVQDSAGGTYTLIATPYDIPSETVILKSSEVKKADLIERSDQPYVEQIKLLVRDMSVGGKESSLVEEIGQIVNLWQETELWLVRRYTTTNFVGEEYSLTNKTKKNLTFSEQEFGNFGDKVRAVALEKFTLNPNETMRVFVVRSL